MSNTRIIDMQQKQIIRLYDLGHSQRSISRQLGIHRKTVRDYINRFKASKSTVEELIDPSSDLRVPLDLSPPSKEPDKRYKFFHSFVEVKKELRSKPGFTVDNLYADYIETGVVDPYSRAHFYKLLRELWKVNRGSIKLHHT